MSCMSTKERMNRLNGREVIEGWTNKEKMLDWGFGCAEYLDETGRLDRQAYVDGELRARLSRGINDEEFSLGELRIPAWLVKQTVEEEMVGIFVANFGLGHLRPATQYQMLMETLGLPTVLVDLSELNEEGDNPLAMYVVKAFQERYLRVSHQNGYHNGSAHKEAYFEKSKSKWWINAALDTWKLLDRKGYEELILGRPAADLTPEVADRLIGVLSQWLGEDFRVYLGKLGVSRNMIFYPIVSAIGFDGPTVVVGTDAVVDPRGWRSDYPTLVEIELARERFRAELGEEASHRVLCFGGFATPLGGLIRAEELGKIRRDELLFGGQKLTLVLTASGVATAQKRMFEETIKEIADGLNKGEMRLVIQTGYGKLGRQVYESMARLMGDLKVDYPSINDGVLLHWSEDPRGAVDFVEVLSSGEAPLVFAGKGGELTRMLVQLGVPHIVTGAIGDQECWNIIVAALQDSQIEILPKAHEQVSEFINKFVGFPEDLKRSAHLAVDRHRRGSLTDGLVSATWAIAEGRTMVKVNRQAMVETLEWLMRQ